MSPPISWRESSFSASLGQRIDQRPGGEDVVAHRGERGLGVVRQTGRLDRLLEKLLDLVVGRGVDHAERAGLAPRHPDACHCAPEAAVDMRLEHLRDVHPIDVVRAEDHDIVGFLVADQVHRLIDRVSAALVPPRPEALLRGHGRDVVAEHRRHPPRQRDVFVERVRLVLRQHRDLPHPRVGQIGEHEVDQAIGAPERDRRFCAIHGQRHQPFSFAASQYDRQNSRTRAHELNLADIGLWEQVLGHVVVNIGDAVERCQLWRWQTTDRLSISLLTREYPPSIYGGAGVHVAQLVPQLRKLIDVDVQCMGEPREGATAHAENYPEGANAALRVFGADLSMVAAIPQVDLVHSHTWYANLAGHLAGLFHDIPHVVTAHSLEPHRPWKAEQLGGGYRLSSWAEQTAFEAADAVIAVSAGMRKDTLDSYTNLDPDKVHVVKNGIDTEEFKPDPGTDVVTGLGIDLDKPSVVFVGRITRQKGLIHLVRAAEKFDPETQVVLLAGAPDTPEIAQQIGDAFAHLQSTRGNVLWIEEMLPRAQVRQVLSHATVFACPSVYEPLGIVNLEAMACETAVVASAVGGIPEVVVDGVTGYLVPYDPAQADDPDSRRRL